MQIKAAPCQKYPCMLSVLSHAPRALCSAWQGLIFVYRQELADLRLPFHTCITRGRPKIHTYCVCTSSLFMYTSLGRRVCSLLVWEYDSEVELNSLPLARLRGALKAVLAGERRWLLSRHFGAGISVPLLKRSDPD